jgi:hypothetical protein
MANEISVRGYLTGTKNGVTVTGDTTKSITLAGSQLASGVQEIGTATEQLSFPGDLTTEGIGYLYLKNLDATNFIEVGLNTPLTQILVKLTAGQVAVFPPYSGNPTIYCKADTAACDLQWVAVGT